MSTGTSAIVRSPAAVVAAVILAASLGLVAASASAEQTAAQIVFASGPDDTGTVQRLVDRFNGEHAGRIDVTWRQMDRDNNAHHEQLVSDFNATSAAPHVIASDVIWTAQFAKNGWVEDLTKSFYDLYARGDFLGPALDSATYRLRIWGVPWYSDTSMLFYRKDLLARSGFDAPPQTWDDLVRMARQVMKDSGTRHGFVFQGAQYEGGTANALEYIWSAGGGVMRSELTMTGPVHGTLTENDAVTVKSEMAAAGLDRARRLITEGIAPADVAEFREKDALDAFLAGDAVFLRSWPYVHGIVQRSSLTAAQVGVSWLPAGSGDDVGYSCLGGWNLMVNARADRHERAAAWEFIRYLTSPAQQKRQALDAGLLPVLDALYDDPEILASVPIAALAKHSMSSRVRVRPLSPFYADLSLRIASVFHRVLKGELTGTEAVDSLDQDLRAIAIRNR